MNLRGTPKWKPGSDTNHLEKRKKRKGGGKDVLE